MRNRLAAIFVLLVVLPGCWRSEAVDQPRSIEPSRSHVVTTPAPPPTPSSAASTPPVTVAPVDTAWGESLDAIVGDPRVSVAVGVGRRVLYTHIGARDRVPASAQKVLTSIVALDTFGPRHRFPTVAASPRRVSDGVLGGDLWLVGAGDPEVDAERLATLARAVHAAGVRRVTGDVIGDTGAFSRRWWAPGWVEDLSRAYVRRPTALTFDGNAGTGAPELAAASSFAASLRAAGVDLGGVVRVGNAPSGLRAVASVRSDTLADLLGRQNGSSLNLYAELLLRAIGDRVGAGTTAAGAETVEAWAHDRGVAVRVRDGSGLSHRDAASAVDLVSLLLIAGREPWGRVLEGSLARPGEGTLSGRLDGVAVRAKTGTLFTVPCSALAGYVRDAEGRRVAFAVLSEGLGKPEAVVVEDSVVRVLATHAIA